MIIKKSQMPIQKEITRLLNYLNKDLHQIIT
jgi:hypothetical protein